MSYLGNAPARSFISFERQVFSIVNSQTAYALSHSVTNENDIRLVVNNVVQEPGSGKAYTATGTALTLSAALTNGTDEMYCVFLGRATATNAPGAGSVGTVQLADNATTLAKMASGTDGNIISYDTSGNPVAVATGSAGQFLKSAGAGAVPSFATIPAGGANTPAFYAQSASNQGWADDATAKIVFGTEVYDTNNTFADSKFTPGVAGTYKIYCGIQVGTATTAYGAVAHCRLQLYKNGSTFIRADYDSRGSSGGNGFVSFTLNGNWSVVADDNDYYEIYVYADVESSTPVAYALGGGVNFGAFKLIT